MFPVLAALIQPEDNGGAIAALVGGLGGILGLIVGLIAIAALWRIFTKAGEPGWAAIIPIYNIIVLLRIVGRPWWWLLLMFIPFVNFIILIIVYIDLAKSFGRSTLFGIGLIFLSFIFMLILAFGSSQYRGPAAAQGSLAYS